MDELLVHAIADARALAEGGCDALMVENFGDAPFRKGDRNDPVAPDTVAALAVAAREVRMATGLPVGVNCLRNDAIGGLGAGAVAEASYVRVNVLNGAMWTDQGLIEGEAARVRDYRLALGYRPRILADVLVKHATPIGDVDALEVARDLIERSGADVLVVSGNRTGAAVDTARLHAIRSALPTTPLWIGSGLAESNAAALWPLCDGAIVGTSLKTDGRVHAPVDVARVRALHARLRR